MTVNYSTNTVYISTLIILIVSLLLLAWQVNTDNQRFYEAQVKLAETAVATTKNNLQQHILQKRQMVAAIVEYEKNFLNKLVETPNDTQSILHLQRHIENRFDDYFSFMLTDQYGVKLLQNNNLLVGEQCQLSLQSFAESEARYQEDMLIHGNGINNYHFDVMRKINHTKESPIFFVSFRLNQLVELLKMVAVPGQSIVIVKDFNPETVLISTKGAFRSPMGEPKMNQATLSTVLYQSSLPGTDWRILVLPEDSLFSEHLTFLVKRAVLMYLALLIVIMFFLLRLKIASKTVLNLESQLKQTNRKTDHHLTTLQPYNDEKNYEHAFFGSPYGMLITDANGVIESVNKQAEKIFEYQSEDLIGQNVDCLVPNRFRDAHKAQRDSYRQKMDRKLMGSGRYLYAQTRDGKELPVEIGLNPIEHSSGVKIIVSVTDISRLVSAQEQLMEEHERAVVTLSSIGDGVITTDNNGIIDSINSMAEKMTGWSSTEAIGQHITDVFKIINEKTGETLNAAIVHCLNDKVIVQERLETQLVNKNGLNTPIQESAAPIHNAHGDMIGAVLVFHDVTQMRNYANEIEYHANHDVLTGLLNRREFDARLCNTLKRKQQNIHENVLLFLDIDRFKVINDTAGHLAGDEFLKQVSGVILGKLRGRDTFSRLGGDEFGILLENCSMDNGHKIARDICQAIEQFNFFWNKQMFSVSISIGLIAFQSEDSPDELLSKADAACYTAKKSGRNRVQIYDEKAAKKYDESHVVNMLTHAFEKDLMVLYQQRIQAVSL